MSGWFNWKFWVVCGVVALAPAQGPLLRFDAPTIELGEIRSGVPAGCRFAFVNVSANPVEIVEVRPGCGCVQPRLNQQQFGAGARGEVPLELKTLGQAAGPHTWHLTLFYRDGEVVHEQALQVNATVVTEVSVQPASVTLFTEGAAQHTITVTDLRSEPLRILGLEVTSPHLRAQAAPFIKDASGHFTSKIAMQTASELPVGRHDELLIIHTNDPVYGEFKIPVIVVKQSVPRVTATPSDVVLSGPRLVRLRDKNDQPVMIESVQCDQTAVTWQWAAGPDNQATLKLRLDATKIKVGESSAVVRVQLTSPVREVVTIPVRWEDEK